MSLGLWEFFWDTSSWTGQQNPSNGGYVLPYVSRRLRFFSQLKKVYPTVAPAVVARKPLVYFKSRRPLRQFYRPKHIVVPQPPIAREGHAGYALPFVSRRLCIFGRPKHIFGLAVPQPPSSLSWKRPVNRHRLRRPLWRFYRPKHIFGLGAAPQIVTVVRLPLPRMRPRKLLKQFFRQKHIFGLATAPQSSSLSWKRPAQKLRPQRRPLWRFFRPRHVYGLNPPQPVSAIFWKRPPRPRITRARINVQRIHRSYYVVPGVAPAAPKPGSWIIRARRRMRR